MSAPSPAELLAFLLEHGFLPPAQAPQLSAGGHAPFADGRGLIRALVGRGWLTAYQANRLSQGKGIDLILGPYRVLDRLGEGCMGQVFKAQHVKMDRLVALKVIRKELVSNPVAVDRFYREVKAVAKLSHANIVTAFDVSQAGATHYLAMEYVDGIDLERLVGQSGPLPIASACDYIRQAAEGLQHAHEKGLVHRDIKPGNLMVARPSGGGPPVLKVLDFGLVRLERGGTRSEGLTQSGAVVGTLDYMAPEQAASARTVDIRADVYSLGCALFFLLAGRPPFAERGGYAKVAAHKSEEPPPLA